MRSAWLIGKGHKVAVLAVDPSSARTGGSILGDKTRMARLSAEADAFIRPSPSSGTLGGVAAKTREAMLLCEAAGFDVVLVETVGIGQSETAVCDMTDFFLALMLPGAGDELQGIKKGLVELADMIAVNKADGDNLKRAKAAAAEYNAALHILAPRPSTGFRQFSPIPPSPVTDRRGVGENRRASHRHGCIRRI
jgi:LAO/AO transport system kinase